MNLERASQSELQTLLALIRGQEAVSMVFKDVLPEPIQGPPPGEERETEEVPIPVARCLACGAIMHDTDGCFTGAPVVPSSRWLKRDGALLHMCHGYAEPLGKTVAVDVWRKEDAA